jgi:predicted PurR-regulated permease PerM
MADTTGTGCSVLGFAGTALGGGVQRALTTSVYDWLDAHPLLSWLISHPLYTIAGILLTLLLLSGLLRAFGRMSEQVWIFILRSPFRLTQWIFKTTTAVFIAKLPATQVKEQNTQERLAEILTRLETLRQEQDSLMQEIKTILQGDTAGQ